MCHKRIKVLNEAFDQLDFNADGLLDFYDFENWFKINHLCFQNCKKNDEKLTKVSN